MLYHIFAHMIFMMTTLACCIGVIICGCLRCPNGVHTILYFWGRSSLWLHRVSFVGPISIFPTQERYLFMSNHQSNFDTMLLIGYFSATLRYISKIEVLFIPIFGIASWLAGNIHIARKKHKQAVETLNMAGKKIHAGRDIVIFPEGTRTHDSNVLLPFKKGGFVLAISAQLPIVPIGIAGTFSCWPRQRWIPQEGKVSICVGEPISTKGLTVEDRDSLMERVRQEILRLSQKAQETISQQK